MKWKIFKFLFPAVANRLIKLAYHYNVEWESTSSLELRSRFMAERDLARELLQTLEGKTE